MSAYAIRWDGYDYAEESDRRFRRLLLGVAVPFLLLVILSLIYKVEGQKQGGGTYSAPAMVELLPAEVAPLAEQVEEPSPTKEDSKEEPQEAAPKKSETPVPKPVANAEPLPDPVETAREVAKRTGVLAFSQALSEMRSKGDSLNSDQPLLSSKGAASTASGGASGGAANDADLAAAAAGSSGIGGAGAAGVTRTQSGSGLGKRRTTTVQSPVGFGRDASKAGEAGNKRNASRTLAELQLTFDRAQGSFYAMLIKAQRENPSLSGKVILSLTIAPSGKVERAEIVSSELGDSDLEKKILTRVLLLNFGAKDVPPFTYPNYPIVFTPAR